MLENNLNAAAARMFLQNEIERKWNTRPDNETIRRMLRFMRKWPKTTSHISYEEIAKHYVFGKGE